VTKVYAETKLMAVCELVKAFEKGGYYDVKFLGGGFGAVGFENFDATGDLQPIVVKVKLDSKKFSATIYNDKPANGDA
jgi:hypothetical protein